ncbi:MAG: phosphatase PAP2 family protein [Phycisphaeraceae bacterium]|nr:phosphatase PAP2 family protein [Phycisphaeraceae bacterium]
MRLRIVLAIVALATTVNSLRADVATDWNQVYLECVRVEGGPPCPASRWATHLYVAMFDAANSVFGDYSHVIVKENVTRPTSARAAIAAAAYTILSEAYPAQQAFLDESYSNSIKMLPPGLPRARGMQLGRRVAQAVMAARADDGSDDDTPYVYGSNPGDWTMSDSDIFDAPATPNWGKVRPWAMTKSTQFRVAGPGGFRKMARLLASQIYADQFNEVKELGERNSATRTQDQTDIAWFWANDVDGTSKPPGQLLQITEAVSIDQGLDFYQKTRLFALVALAMGDSCIAAWDAKYRTWCDLWRPQEAIRNADIDGNPQTEADANWLPLAPWTPPFPAYVSGHATFGATHAAIMRNYFRTDRMNMAIYTDDPHYTGPSPRHYTSFTEIARENGRSRIYLGVHYQFDADMGYALGTLVGNYVFANKARPLCSADYNNDGIVDNIDVLEFTDAYFAGNKSADFDKNGVVDEFDYFDFLNAYTSGCN